MSDVVSYPVGSCTVTRVPYFDVALSRADLNLADAAIDAAGAAATPWLDGAGQPLVGQVVWVIESGDRVVAVDPCGAADLFIRTGPDAITHQDAVFTAMTAAGFPRERVDTVVLSHLDGIGMAAAMTDSGEWVPAFPNARIVLTHAELDFLEAPTYEPQGLEVLRTLIAQGAVDGASDGDVIAPDVSLQLTGAHSPGHAIVRVESDGALALFIGHLALSPIHLVSGPCAGLHEHPDRAYGVVQTVLDEAVERSALVIGPLFPSPGACRIGADRVPKPA